MGVVATDGFDFYNGTATLTGLQAKWTATAVGSVTLPAGRFGGQCVQIAFSSVTSYSLNRNMTAARAAGAFGFALRYTTFPTTTTLIVDFALRSATTFQHGFRINADGSISVYRNSTATAGTLLGSSAAGVIVINTWHYIEWIWTLSTTVGAVTIKVDGTAVLTLTGVNNANAGVGTTANNFYISQDSNNGQTKQVDDWYECDTAASLGERKVEPLRATADTAQKDFTPNSGLTNFSRVNETLVDGDTSYVQASTVGNRDLYTIGALGSTPATIDCVTVVSFAEKTDATTRTIYNSVQSGGVDSDGSAFSLAASYSKFERCITADPNGGGAWTASGVNNLLIGPKVAS